MSVKMNDLSDFQKEILKQEIEIIDKTISRIDQIQQSMKNWTITLWGGSLYLIIEHFVEQPSLLFLTAIIPILFGYIDIVWKRQILVVGYRQQKISEFISGCSRENDFKVLDPIAKSYLLDSEFKSSTNCIKAIKYKADGIFYLVLILCSLLLGTAFSN